jgi:hypothetical protein
MPKATCETRASGGQSSKRYRRNNMDILITCMTEYMSSFFPWENIVSQSLCRSLAPHQQQCRLTRLILTVDNISLSVVTDLLEVLVITCKRT